MSCAAFVVNPVSQFSFSLPAAKMSIVLSVWKSGLTIIYPSRSTLESWLRGIRAILRRTREGKGALEPAQPVRVGDVELDPATRSVRQNGKPVELTSVEFNLLHALLREAGHVVPRERLVDIVLSRKFSPFDRSIDMHVSKIRKKLGDSEGANDHIKTVRGVGYIFARPQERPQNETSDEKARTSRS